MHARGADSLASYHEHAVALVHDTYTGHADEIRTHWSAQEHEEQIRVLVLPLCGFHGRYVCVHVNVCVHVKYASLYVFMK